MAITLKELTLGMRPAWEREVAALTRRRIRLCGWILALDGDAALKGQCGRDWKEIRTVLTPEQILKLREMQAKGPARRFVFYEGNRDDVHLDSTPFAKIEIGLAL